MKEVKWNGLTIIGDANKIDELIYNKEENVKVEVEDANFKKVVEDIYEFNNGFIPSLDAMVTEEVTDWIKQFIVCIGDELSELLAEIPWKHWKEYPEDFINRDNILGEIADILIFTIGIAGILEFTPEEILEELTLKNRLNNTRQEEGY